MNSKTIIADAGPLIAFGKIKQINLLANLLGEIIISETVLKECISDTSKPGAHEIIQAMEKELISLHKNPDTHHHETLFKLLGHGEATSIVLASQLKTSLLIDDKLGRKVASEMKIKIIGSVGVLIRSKKKDLIPKALPLAKQLREAGYYITDELMEWITKECKESDR